MAALAVLAGCGSAASSAPGWAAGLGPGVTVSPPASAAPGDDSPAAAVQGLFAALAARQFVKVCDYFQPDFRSRCQATYSNVQASQMPSVTNAGIGYVAVDGAQALVGTTGTFCQPTQTPRCYTNTDPAAIFSKPRPFAQLWAATLKSSGASTYQLAPCVEVAGKWYLSSGQ
jgi:hypothetical protein